MHQRSWERCGISKPDQYRNHGETLISDPDEARMSRVTKYAEVVDDPHQLTEERLRADEANRAAEIAGARVTRTPKSTKRTRRNTDTLTSGKNGWIFCTAIAPSTPEEGERLWRSMSPKYDHASHIYRPRAFASALSSMVADQCGPQGSKMTMQVRFGDLSARCRRASQTVFHGPVVYAEDPYEVVTSAQSELEKILLPMFLKASGHGHADQREYRFVIWTNEEPRDPYVDLKISSSMIDAMRERRNAPIDNDNPFTVSSDPSPRGSTERLSGASQPAANDERDTLATVSVEEGLLPDVLDFIDRSRYPCGAAPWRERRRFDWCGRTDETGLSGIANCGRENARRTLCGSGQRSISRGTVASCAKREVRRSRADDRHQRRQLRHH